jgi:hypothetical protein
LLKILALKPEMRLGDGPVEIVFRIFPAHRVIRLFFTTFNTDASYPSLFIARAP